MKELRKLWKQYWLAILLLIAALFILNLLTGSACLSVIILGIPCPACGLSRATGLLIIGKFSESFKMHPLLIFVIIGCLLYPLLKYTMKRYKLILCIYVIITITTFMCFYFYRMLHYYPELEPMVYHKDNLLAKAHAVIQLIRHK